VLEHGGNLTRAAAQYGIPLAYWLDISTGINPNGYPVLDIPSLLWQRLPLANDGLHEAALAYYDARHVLATPGSQAAIQALPKLRSACQVAMPDMMYAEHARNWTLNNHQVTRYSGIPDEALLNATDVLVVCNPNNPTGNMIAPATLLAWHAKLAKRGGWLVIDEAFMDCSPEFSLAPYAHLAGLVILRSLGKFFGLAGARVGFVLAQPSLLNQLEETLGPWPIAGPARFIARHALQNSQWQRATRNNLNANSQRLHSLLSQHGLVPEGSHALYQWVPTKNAEAWHQHLARQGIWVRLFQEWSALRFGLPPDAGWERLEAALKNSSVQDA